MAAQQAGEGRMPLFVLIGVDHRDSGELRARTRAAHLGYVESHAEQVRIAGPLLADDGETMIGSLLIIEADSLEEAHAFAEADPYALAGLFAHIDIRPWKWLIGRPD
jgi:uncharacterized protein YciI